LSGRVFLLLRIFFVNDGLGTSYACCVQFWHIYHNLKNGTEIFTRPDCFWINGILFFFLSNNALIPLMVALDRLHCTLHPQMKYPKNFQPTPVSIAMLVVPFVVSGLLYLLAMLDNGDKEIIVVYCTSRASTGPRSTILVWASIFGINLVTTMLYVVMLVKASRGNGQVEPTTHNEAGNHHNETTNNAVLNQVLRTFHIVSSNFRQFRNSSE